MKFVLAAMAVLQLTACSYQYQQQICDNAHRADLPAFAGHYTVVFQDQDFKSHRVPYAPTHLGVGHYSDQSGHDTFTCVINKKTYAEMMEAQYTDPATSQTVQGFHAYSVTPETWGFSLIPLNFDVDALKAKAVSFRIVNLQTDPNQSPDNYLVIDNFKSTPEAMIAASVPSSYSVRLEK